MLAGAIGTAEFSGARLSDVLAYAGLDADAIDDVEHIQFEGLDSDISGTCYGASIPVSKAVSRHEDVILAYEMNGRYASAHLILEPVHFCPLRIAAAQSHAPEHILHHVGSFLWIMDTLSESLPLASLVRAV